MTTLSQVQEILLSQIRAQVPDYGDRFGVQTIVVDGEEKLKFCLRKPGVVVNLIIEYNMGTDLYDVEGWTIDGVDFWKSYELPGAYSEMLPDAFKGALKAGRDKSQKKLANALITHSAIAKTHDLKKWM